MNFKIEKFKCFSSAMVPLNKLTVLCGKNSAGKSTIIQALLLYRAAKDLNIGEYIAVNDSNGLALGSSDSLFTQEETPSKDVLRFSLDEIAPDTLTNVLELSLPEGDEGFAVRSLLVSSIPEEHPLKNRTPFFFNYLSAERNGPRISQERFSDEAQSGSVGPRGEFTAEILLNSDRRKIRPELVYQFSDKQIGAGALLLQAVQEWMSAIVGPIEIRSAANGNSPPSILFKRPGVHDDWVISTNTGFGISYTLPIVVAGLLSPVGGYLIIDSPEAHLHPAAQTAIAKFLAWIASSGVHVIIETHSDHVIDGIRLATVTPNLRLQANECAILNIHRNEADEQLIEELKIEDKGRLSRWPNDFFDQQSKNLRDIADAARQPTGT